MRSEKGITLVALIGIFVLVVVLAGISISIAGKGNDDVQTPTNDVVTNLEDEEYEEELVVDPTAGSTVENDAEVVTEEDETVENVVNENTVEEGTVTNTVVEEDETNTIANEA